MLITSQKIRYIRGILSSALLEVQMEEFITAMEILPVV